MKTFIVANLTLSSKRELTQQRLEEFTDNLAYLLRHHELSAAFDLAVTVRLAIFDDDGNEVSSGIIQEL